MLRKPNQPCKTLENSTMKKCSHCGKEYSDDVLICPIDTRLVIDVKPGVDTAMPASTPLPKGFGPLYDGSFGPGNKGLGPRYKQVGGWLYLFLFSITFFNPIMTFLYLLSAFSTLDDKNLCTFSPNPGPLIATSLYAIVLIYVAGFGAYAGEKLWKIRPNAVALSKRFLFLYLASVPLAVLYSWYMAPYLSQGGDNSADYFKIVSRGVFYFAIWYGYLCNSKRVKLTY